MNTDRKDTNMVTNKVLSFALDSIREETMSILSETKQISKNAVFSQKIRERMQDICEAFRDQLDPKAIVSYYDRDQLVFSEDGLLVNGIKLESSVFGRVNPASINGVFVYFLSAGKYTAYDSAPAADQLIIDLLGTAAVEAIRLYVRELFKKETFISEEFGPGLYGMDVRQMHRLNLLADASRAGIRIKESGMLVPVKSCGAFCFDVTEDYVPFHSACKSCRGSSGSCSLCLVGR